MDDMDDSAADPNAQLVLMREVRRVTSKSLDEANDRFGLLTKYNTAAAGGGVVAVLSIIGGQLASDGSSAIAPTLFWALCAFLASLAIVWMTVLAQTFNLTRRTKKILELASTELAEEAQRTELRSRLSLGGRFSLVEGLCFGASGGLTWSAIIKCLLYMYERVS